MLKTCFLLWFIVCYSKDVASKQIKCGDHSKNTDDCEEHYKKINKVPIKTTTSREFPHMAFVGVKTSSGHSYIVCSGSIIGQSREFVITAAQCVKRGPVSMFVSVGDHSSESTSVQIPVKAAHVRSDFNKTSYLKSDIALLELEFPIHNTNTYIACLWDEHSLFGSTSGTISSMNRFNVGSGSKEILDIKANFVSDEECKKFYHFVTETNICAVEPVDTGAPCMAVAGAPLQIVLSEPRDFCTFHIVGITSTGDHFCEGKPTVFTRVSSYIGWIDSIVGSNEV